MRRQGKFLRFATSRLLRAAFERTQPEIVFHLAAQSLVRLSYREPVATYATNVMGTVHVLAAAAATPCVNGVIVVTSDKCYENREWLWAYRENEPLGGHDPYSSSKACAELVTSAWRRSFFGAGADRIIGIATVRAGNVIGGGDWAEDRLVPDCMRALLAGEAIAVRNPQATRPWQFVLDPLAGYMLLAEHLCRDPDRNHLFWRGGRAAARAPVRHRRSDGGQQRPRARPRPQRFRRRVQNPAQALWSSDIRVPASPAADRRVSVRHDLPRAFLVFFAACRRCDLRPPWADGFRCRRTADAWRLVAGSCRARGHRPAAQRRVARDDYRRKSSRARSHAGLCRVRRSGHRGQMRSPQIPDRRPRTPHRRSERISPAAGLSARSRRRSACSECTALTAGIRPGSAGRR